MRSKKARLEKIFEKILLRFDSRIIQINVNIKKNGNILYIYCNAKIINLNDKINFNLKYKIY